METKFEWTKKSWLALVAIADHDDPSTIRIYSILTTHTCQEVPYKKQKLRFISENKLTHLLSIAKKSHVEVADELVQIFKYDVVKHLYFLHSPDFILFNE